MTCSGQDFAPVSRLARFEFCVFVRTAVPAEIKDFKQLVAWRKANPDRARSACPATAPFRIFGVYS
jgi:tripartite-type tricarboxylate transporter receptor subunit TctC